MQEYVYIVVCCIVLLLFTKKGYKTCFVINDVHSSTLLFFCCISCYVVRWLDVFLSRFSALINAISRYTFYIYISEQHITQHTWAENKWTTYNRLRMQTCSTCMMKYKSIILKNPHHQHTINLNRDYYLFIMVNCKFSIIIL